MQLREARIVMPLMAAGEARARTVQRENTTLGTAGTRSRVRRVPAGAVGNGELGQRPQIPILAMSSSKSADSTLWYWSTGYVDIDPRGCRSKAQRAAAGLDGEDQRRGDREARTRSPARRQKQQGRSVVNPRDTAPNRRSRLHPTDRLASVPLVDRLNGSDDQAMTHEEFLHQVVAEIAEELPGFDDLDPAAKQSLRESGELLRRGVCASSEGDASISPL